MRRYLALVVSLVPLVSILDEKLPVIGRLIFQRVPRITAVRVQPECDEVQAVLFASYPRYLVQRKIENKNDDIIYIASTTLVIYRERERWTFKKVTSKKGEKNPQISQICAQYKRVQYSYYIAKSLKSIVGGETSICVICVVVVGLLEYYAREIKKVTDEKKGENFFSSEKYG